MPLPRQLVPRNALRNAPRAGRAAAALCVLAALVCVIYPRQFKAPVGLAFAVARPSFAVPSVQPLGAAIAYIARVVTVLLPGFGAAFGIQALYSRWERPIRVPWLLTAALLAVVVFTTPLAVDSRQAISISSPANSAVPSPHSGEERLSSAAGGRFVRQADPRQPEGAPVHPGWQQALWMSMSEAIQRGEEQVVIVFSRQGCPWCDRLLPVVQHAILQRIQVADDLHHDRGLISAPLRVFVYDAEEFGAVIERFRIQGFPTLLAFGDKGVKPRMVPGYLDSENFAKLLSEVASAEPELAVLHKKKRWGILR